MSQKDSMTLRQWLIALLADPMVAVLVILAAVSLIIFLASIFGGQYLTAFNAMALVTLATAFFSASVKNQNESVGKKFERLLLPFMAATTAVMMVYLYLRFDSNGFAWSDEWVYLVQARVIAAVHRIETHLYIASSVITNGMPQSDVHMAGNSLIISLAYSLFGVSQKTSIIASEFCYFFSPFFIYALGKKLMDGPTGAMAALLYLSCPFFGFYSGTAMQEAPCVFFFLLLLYAIFSLPAGDIKSALAALLFCINVIFREFAAAFFLPLLTILFFETPPVKRLRTFAVFFSALLLFLAIIVFPLNQHRGVYPVLSTLLLHDWLHGNITLNPQIMNQIEQNFNANFKSFMEFSSNSGHDWMKMGYILLLLVPIIGYGRLRGSRRLLFYTFFLWLNLFALVFIFYEFRDWRGMRPMMLGIPLLLLLTCRVFTQKSSHFILRFIFLAGFVGTFIFLGWVGEKAAAELYGSRQSDTTGFGSQERMLAGIFQGKGEVTAVAPFCLSLPWNQFPTKVVWLGCDSLDELAKLDKVLKIDYLVLPQGHPLIYTSGLGTVSNPTASDKWVIMNSFRYTKTAGIFLIFERFQPPATNS